MGAGLSSLFLLGGLITVTVLDVYASLEAEKQNWNEFKKWAGLTIGVSAGLVLLSLFILVKTKGGNPEADIFVGANLAFLLALLAMIGVAIMNIFALAKASTDGHKLAAWSAVLASVTFVLAIILIVLLM